MPAVCPPSATGTVSVHKNKCRNATFINDFSSDVKVFCCAAEFVMVIMSLRFLNVTVAETEFTFYNCSLVQQLSGRRP